MLAGLLALAAPAAAAATDLSTTADGAVRLTRDGGPAFVVPLQTPGLRRGTPTLALRTVQGRDLAMVRCPIRGNTRTEVWVGEAQRSGWRTVWQGEVGPRDVDGESHTDVVLDDGGLLSFQTAAQVTRCDGLPARLFPTRWDFASARFRPVLSATPPAAARTLVGKRGDTARPAAPPTGGFRFVAASSTAAAGTDARALAAPSALDDGDPATVWSEGLGGDGRGEFLTARVAGGSQRVVGLSVTPGNAATAQSFAASNRPRRVHLGLGHGDVVHGFEIELPEGDARSFRQPVWIALPEPVEASCLTLSILEVAPGTDARPPRSLGTTALSDVLIYTDVDGAGGLDRIVADVASGGSCAARLPLLVSLGSRAVAPVQAALAQATGLGRECLVEALIKLEAPLTPASTAALVPAFRATSAREEVLLTAALRSAPLPVDGLVKLLADASAAAPDRVRAARFLAQTGSAASAAPVEAALAALIDRVGRPPAEVARAASIALASPDLASRAGVPLLTALDGAQADESRRTGLLRVVGAVAARDVPLRKELGSRVRAIWADPASSWTLLGSAVLAAGAAGDASLVPDLMALRTASHDATLRYLAVREAAALLQQAVHAAGAADKPRLARQAGATLLVALDDGDPRVRAVTAEGLGRLGLQGADGHRVEVALVKAAKQEIWPATRKADVEALGQLCGGDAREILIRAVDRDEGSVRRAGMKGLARCRDPRARDRFLRIAGDGREDPTVRDLAVSLVASLSDRAAARPLAELLGKVRVESSTEPSLNGVTASIQRALGRLGGPEAIEASVAALADPRPQVRLGAIEALSHLCDGKAGADALRRASRDPDADVARAATAALERCQAR